jgi:hypothetical protein
VVIRKVGREWRVVAETGRNMGTYSTKLAAQVRLRQIEAFKKAGASYRRRKIHAEV